MKVFDGNPGKRPLPEDEPHGTGLPTMPKWLAKFPEAVELWEWAIRVLGTMKVVTEADGPMLAMLCRAYAEMRRLEEMLYGDNPTVTETQISGRTGFASESPQVRMLAAARKELYTLLGEFGLSPSSRARIKTVPGGGPGDALAEFLKRRSS
jgi:P27 family predicted phage terminase small subunit